MCLHKTCKPIHINTVDAHPYISNLQTHTYIYNIHTLHSFRTHVLVLLHVNIFFSTLVLEGPYHKAGVHKQRLQTTLQVSQASQGGYEAQPSSKRWPSESWRQWRPDPHDKRQGSFDYLGFRRQSPVCQGGAGFNRAREVPFNEKNLPLTPDGPLRSGGPAAS